LPTLEEFRQCLPAGTVYLAATILGDEVYLLSVVGQRGGPPRCQVVAAEPTRRRLQSWRHCLSGQLDRYQRGLPLGPREGAELQACLAALGSSPLGAALFALVRETQARRLVWVPDATLQGFPCAALHGPGGALIDIVEMVQSVSAAFFVHQVRTRRQQRWRWRPTVVVAETPEVLPQAEQEAKGVAGTFLRAKALVGPAAQRRMVRQQLSRACVAHFACHADFEAEHPLAAALHLPSGESIRALEWLAEPVAGLRLVTLSSCRSGEVGSYLGRETFGQVTGLLGAGVRAVLASLWTIADRETCAVMWRFYRHRLTCDLATALARTQRELQAAGVSALFWAAFTLFGEGDAIPAPVWPWRAWARWRQRRHKRRYHCLVNG
jgi:hypothetical protein